MKQVFFLGVTPVGGVLDQVVSSINQFDFRDEGLWIGCDVLSW